MYATRIKRLLDILFGSLLLVACTPVILVTMLVSCLVQRSFRVFFIQTRTGYRNRPFKIIKLRTMSNEMDGAGQLLPNADRTSPFGTFLRRTSLDELPQLINVIKGDMSLVGPRPFTPEDCARYGTPEQMRVRHGIRPGLTGLAQIHGRNTIAFDQRIRYDLFYVEHISFALDCGIFFRTANVVLETTPAETSSL